MKERIIMHLMLYRARRRANSAYRDYLKVRSLDRNRWNRLTNYNTNLMNKYITMYEQAHAAEFILSRRLEELNY